MMFEKASREGEPVWGLEERAHLFVFVSAGSCSREVEGTLKNALWSTIWKLRPWIAAIQTSSSAMSEAPTLGLALWGFLGMQKKSVMIPALGPQSGARQSMHRQG